MTKYDIKEYLEKIYSIPVAGVRLADVTWVRRRDEAGKWHFRDPFKIAHVTLVRAKVITIYIPMVGIAVLHS